MVSQINDKGNQDFTGRSARTASTSDGKRTSAKYLREKGD